MTEKARVPNTDLTFSILHASRAFFITAFFFIPKHATTVPRSKTDFRKATLSASQLFRVEFVYIV
jgi:hypothetical protein